MVQPDYDRVTGGRKKGDVRRFYTEKWSANRIHPEIKLAGTTELVCGSG